MKGSRTRAKLLTSPMPVCVQRVLQNQITGYAANNITEPNDDSMLIVPAAVAVSVVEAAVGAPCSMPGSPPLMSPGRLNNNLTLAVLRVSALAATVPVVTAAAGMHPPTQDTPPLVPLGLPPLLILLNI